MKLTDRKAEQYAFFLIGDIETKELSALKNFLIILKHVGIDAVPTNAERDVITAVIVGMPDEVRKIEVLKCLDGTVSRFLKTRKKMQNICIREHTAYIKC